MSGYGQLSDHKFGESDSSNKKKKCIIGGGILVALIVAVIVVVVVATGGGKNTPGDNGGGGKPVNPVDPAVPVGTNPYYIDEKDITRNDHEISGLIKLNESKVNNSEKAVLRRGTEMIFYGNDSNGSNQTNKTYGYAVDTNAIGHGVNNEYIHELHFQFGEAKDHNAFLSLADNKNKERYSVPEYLLPRETLDATLKID